MSYFQFLVIFERLTQYSEMGRPDDEFVILKNEYLKENVFVLNWSHNYEFVTSSFHKVDKVSPDLLTQKWNKVVLFVFDREPPHLINMTTLSLLLNVWMCDLQPSALTLSHRSSLWVNCTDFRCKLSKTHRHS